MRFSEYVASNENVCLKDAIPWLQLIYTYAHNWNVDDSIQNVFYGKRKYVLSDLLECNINKGVIKGKLVYEYICDDEGNPCAVDPDTEEFARELNLDISYVYFKSLINYVVNDVKDSPLIPDELRVIAGMDVPEKNNAPGQGKVNKTGPANR